MSCYYDIKTKDIYSQRQYDKMKQAYLTKKLEEFSEEFDKNYRLIPKGKVLDFIFADISTEDEEEDDNLD